MDGYDTARQIRSDARWGQIPIVAMTAHAMARDHALCLEAGMNEVIVKPFEPHTLFKAVARWLPPTVGLPPPLAPSSPDSATAANASISFESGLSRCLGRVELYHRVLSRFLEMRQSDSARIALALAQKDPATVAQIAHDVVATAGAIGADALSAAAAELQRAAGAASRGEAADWRTPTARFNQLHLDALHQLREHLGVAQPPMSPRED
jgi:HPt (histidine-containing phosphotransfer) domain-containing protein